MSKKKTEYAGNNIREWVNQKATERTFQSLKRKNEAFAIEHAEDSDAQLIAYVKQMAADLGHSPAKEEIIGGEYIAERFGGWAKMIMAAGLPIPPMPPALKRCKVFKDEYKEQMKLLQREFKDNREVRKRKREAEAAAAQAEKDARLQRDEVWAQEHQNDTDAQLLEYLRQAAAQMDHVPCTREVLGGTYINNRFGGWTVALALADLPIPKGMKQPKAKILNTYRNKLRNEKDQGSVDAETPSAESERTE